MRHEVRNFRCRVESRKGAGGPGHSAPCLARNDPVGGKDLRHPGKALRDGNIRRLAATAYGEGHGDPASAGPQSSRAAAPADGKNHSHCRRRRHRGGSPGPDPTSPARDSLSDPLPSPAQRQARRSGHDAGSRAFCGLPTAHPAPEHDRSDAAGPGLSGGDSDYDDNDRTRAEHDGAADDGGSGRPGDDDDTTRCRPAPMSEEP